MIDNLGDRMKDYENRSRFYLPRRTYIFGRLDGKAFHTYSKGLKRPFDDGLIDDMDSVAIYLCKNIMGVKCAFVQSDEITILLTDFDDINTQAWFDNDLRKMCSVSASMATAIFNWNRMCRYFYEINNNIVPDKIFGKHVGEHYKPGTNLEEVHDNIASFVNYFPLGKPYIAEFDSRFWQVPQKTEVINTFIWRQKDATRNSIQSVAQTLYSHKELDKKNSDQLQEMIFQKGINWDSYSPKYKRGRMIVKETYEKEPNLIRTRWISIEPPIFTQDKEFLDKLIPNNF